jgi:hypothetical protein
MDEEIQPLEALLTRFSSPERLPEVQRVDFAEAVRTGQDPLRVLLYLRSLGIEVREPADLFLRNDALDEEELNAFWVPEGVAVCIQSDDLWQVFEIDRPGAEGGARP